MKKIKKHDPRSEAAQREVFKDREFFIWHTYHTKSTIEIHALGTLALGNPGQAVAIFDLRDCYRKRQPLKGITKAVRKAIQPNRKKKS